MVQEQESHVHLGPTLSSLFETQVGCWFLLFVMVLIQVGCWFLLFLMVLTQVGCWFSLFLMVLVCCHHVLVLRFHLYFVFFLFSVFKIFLTFKRLTEPGCLCVCLSVACHFSETSEATTIQLDKVTASVMRRHHVSSFSLCHEKASRIKF